MYEALTSFRMMFRMPPFESPEMEVAFWEWNDRNKFIFRAVFLIAAIITFTAVGTLDNLAGGDTAPLMLQIRAITIAILVVIAFQFIRTRKGAKARERLVLYFGIVAAASIILSTAIAPRPAADYYPFLLSASMIFAGALIVPRFKTLALFCLFVNVTYWPSVPFSQTSTEAVAANLFIMTVTTFAVVVGGFTRERLEREQLIRERELAGARESAIRSRDEALNASRAKSHLLANVSHELRTPMNAILGFSEAMKHEIFGPIDQFQYRGYVKDIHDSGTLLQSSINDLLDVSRLEVDKMSWSESWVSVLQIFERSLQTCAMEAKSAGIRLTGPIDDDGTLLLCDRDRMVQIFVNLITNATKFSESGTTISLSSTASMNSTRLSVTDQGCGIEKNDIARICEPFGQVDANSMTAKKGGLGLGLSIVRGLVAKLDGELEITSELGRGTTVSLIIPNTRVAHGKMQRREIDQTHPHLKLISGEPGNPSPSLSARTADTEVVSPPRTA